ncbi:DUF7521 family protein [Halosimplex salinum]|uniref:DUF7521 family protein n=1 Tax=Halosimplex salinum TaxID=1710538 RepID=UPI001F375F42|nr:hypothetical protein [Halosimplex salinum]
MSGLSPGLLSVVAAVFEVLQTTVSVTPATVARSLTATVGLFVAYQAYRGYRRNDSRPMLFLGLGIFLVTALPFVVTTLLAGALGASDAAVVLAWTVLEILGLGSILYALTGA